MGKRVVTDATLVSNQKYINEHYWYVLKAWNLNGYIDLCISKDKNKLIKWIENTREYDKFLIDWVFAIPE